MNEIKPTIIIGPTLSTLARHEIFLYGREAGNFSLLNTLRETVIKIARILKSFGIKNAHAPNIGAWNQKIGDPFMTSQKGEPLGGKNGIHGVKIWRNFDGEGMLVERNEACILTSADCRTVVLAHECGKTVAFHAGLASLIPLKKIKAIGKGDPKFESVVQNALKYFEHTKTETGGGTGFSPEKIRAWVGCGIGWTDYIYAPNDLTHGKKNRRLLSYLRKNYQQKVSLPTGEISTREIITEQLQKAGVPIENITTDSINTYADIDARGNPLWHSSRRALLTRDGDPGARNLVIVIRRD